MEWLTREWARGEIPKKVADAAHAAYYEHLAALAASSERTVSEFAGSQDPRLDLSDGLVDWIEVDRSNRLVRIRLVQGNLQDGYGLLDVVAREAQLEAPDLERLAKLVASPDTEIWYWELDRSSESVDRFELRFLLWPEGEVDVSFTSLDWTWTERPERKLPLLQKQVHVQDPGVGRLGHHGRVPLARGPHLHSEPDQTVRRRHHSP
jgi:hypothetical protein